MWKKIGGSLIIAVICFAFPWGASSQATISTATSRAAISFTGQYDPPVQKLKKPPKKKEGKAVLPGSGAKQPISSPIVGTLPITGDIFPFGAILLGIILVIMSYLIYPNSFAKLRTRKEEKRT